MNDSKQEITEKNNLVAVYGTLRENQGNWKWALKDNADKLSTERIRGFGMVSLGGFPAVYTSDDSESIVIETYKVDDNTFGALDRLEGYPAFYNRKLVQTSQGEAWLYFIDDAKDNRNKIGNGDWVDFKESLS